MIATIRPVRDFFAGAGGGGGASTAVAPVGGGGFDPPPAAGATPAAGGVEGSLGGEGWSLIPSVCRQAALTQNWKGPRVTRFTHGQRGTGTPVAEWQR